ncbi:MAG: c-type cytochrome [Pseudomonadota bacterium]
MRSERRRGGAGLRGPALLAALGLALAPRPAAPEGAGIEACVACHRGRAEAEGSPVPRLGGQPEMFLLYQPVFFRDGQRRAAPMNMMLEGRSDADLQALAGRLSELPPLEPAEGRDAEAFARGEKLAKAHRCGTCHLSDYAGARHVPRLAGQREAYLLAALEAFRSGERIGIQAATSQALSGLGERDLRDLAHYLSRLPG